MNTAIKYVMFNTFTCAILGLLLFWPAPLKAAQPECAITNLSGNTAAPRQPLVLKFSAPMVEKEQLQKSIGLDKLPYNFSPQISGEGIWTAQDTLNFIPYEQFTPSSVFTLTPKEGAKNLNGQALSQKLVFYSMQLRLENLTQKDYRLDGNLSFIMSFNLPVSPFQLKNSLKITEGGKILPFDIEGAETGMRITITVKPDKLGSINVSLPKNFAPEVGNMGLQGNVEQHLKTTSMLEVQRSYVSSNYNAPWSKYISMYTSSQVDVAKAAKFIEISPSIKFEISDNYGGLSLFGDFKPEQAYTITVKKGLPGKNGYLTKDFIVTINIPASSSNLAIVSTGSVLTPENPLKVTVGSVNVDEADVYLWRLHENNLPLIALGFFDNYQKDLSVKAAVRRAQFKAPRNKYIERSIDVKELAGEKRGVFLLSVVNRDNSDSYADEEYYDYDDHYLDRERERLVLVTDLGIAAQITDSGLGVWVNSLSAAAPVGKAKVRVYDNANQLLAQGDTDANGFWRYQAELPWSEAGIRPKIITVTMDGDKPDLSYLLLSSNMANDSAFEVSGRQYLRSGYTVFSFAPRGVYRPGETADFKMIARTPNNAVPNPFPLGWEVISSVKRPIASGTVMLNAEGSGAIRLPLPNAAPTGSYTLRTYLPGQPKETISSMSFSVEDFTPPRLEVLLESQQKLIVGSEEAEILVKAKYLFGATPESAPFQKSLHMQSRLFKPKGFTQYHFSDAGQTEYTQDDELGEDNLNALGQGSFKYIVGKTMFPSMLDLTFRADVREEGGRWTAKTLTIPYFANKTMLGFEALDAELNPGKPYTLKVAAVNPTGADSATPSALPEITAEVQRGVEHYLSYENGNRSNKTEYTTVLTEKVKLKDGLGAFTFTPKNPGRYRVIFSATQASTASYSTYAWGHDGGTEGASTMMDRVILSLDREKYLAGETAKLKVRSPFTGRLILNVEAAGQVMQLSRDLKNTEEVLDIPITKDMAPNAYCSVWVIRPVSQGPDAKPGADWGQHRAFGVIPISLDMPERKLKIELESPDKALPKGNLPVSLTLKDENGNPIQGEVALALVDEGVLSLTNYRTPDPYAFFTAKCKLDSLFYDLYANLMMPSRAQALLLTGGDGMERALADNLSPNKRKVEVLSIFLASLNTDASGRLETTLALPEYSGKGRLMAVATAGPRSGSAQKNIQIARTVTVEFTTPLAAAPGDTFEIPVDMFKSDDKDHNISLTAEPGGPLTLEGPKIFDITIKEKASRVVLKAKAGPTAGLATLTLNAKIKDLKEDPFTQKSEIDVRPPFPRISLNGGGIVKGGEETDITLDSSSFTKGTLELSLYIADTPAVDVAKALRYLGDYPYGCLEQTISRTWPYLAIPSILKALDNNLASEQGFSQALDSSLKRIAAMQNQDGSFSYWPGGWGRYEWGTVYATHLLTESKDQDSIPDAVLESSLKWLQSYVAAPLSRTDEAAPWLLSTKAYACYVLALNQRAPLGWMQFLKDQSERMSPSGRILLAGAYALDSGNSAPLKQLGNAPIKATRDGGYSLESPSRNEALRLLMWVNVDPLSVECAELAARVIDNGNKKLWTNTQENGLAALALGRYMEKTGAGQKPFTASLSVKGKELAAFDNKKPYTLSYSERREAPKDYSAPLHLKVQGEGLAHYSWVAAGIPTAAPKPYSQGLALEQAWQLDKSGALQLPDDKNPDRIVKIPAGAKVTVTLTLSSQTPVNDVITAFVLPGGLEIENPRMVPGSSEAKKGKEADGDEEGDDNNNSYNSEQTYGRGKTTIIRREIRDDRLLLFIDKLNKPEQISFTLRAVTKGRFALPPVSAEGMYAPSMRVLTRPGVVLVE